MAVDTSTRTIVLDLGTRIKLGYADKPSPTLTVPALLAAATSRDRHDPDLPLHSGVSALLRAPFPRDYTPLSIFSTPPHLALPIATPDFLASLLHPLYESHLPAPIRSHKASPLVLALPDHAAVPRAAKERLAQELFEGFRHPSVLIAPRAPCVVAAAGSPEHAVVFHAGHSGAAATAVFRGYPVATVVADASGAALDRCCAERLAAANPGLEGEALAWAARAVKERECYVGFTEEKSSERTDFMLPDGNSSFGLGDERVKVPEAFFNPAAAKTGTVSAQAAVLQAVKSADRELIRHLLKNVLVSGGATKVRGFDYRLGFELGRGLPKGVEANVSDASEGKRKREDVAWYGASLLAKSPNFSKLAVSAEEYEEHGPAVVMRKCF
eukprot:CAMPEP_0184710228 /NCGR_PEP_ID=MMETSP0314-20130426/1118_1 /TAXON_ID=38298 /ORGANISM="Rhodella maculata, Strain CCMP 736" /LENGTH=383 /DNA_ID=CAMNT_0027172033 /DNA_START=1 /DNA_END=1152 /DNA_ORIENTATION=-